MSEKYNSDGNMDAEQPQQNIFLDSKRFTALHNLLERPGPYCRADFNASRESLEFLQNACTVLVIGAGGLGCEMLKDLALMGFADIHVIDMDTIDLSNLNRQFLFRRSDIGESKAKVAANFVSKRVPTAKVTAYFAKIQDFDESFYQQFHLIICGLDSIPARRWINGMLISLLSYEEDGTLDTSSVIPLIDGGTEGFKGNVRVVFPGLSACIECTLGLYAPQVTYPLCTIASKPRLPEHCVEYVKLMQWQQENPFNMPLDADDPQHLSWVYERAIERANQYNITGVTYRLVQGVLKHIIPAVASTNATIAAVCVNEAFKLVTSCYDNLTNFLMYNNLDGIYTYVFEAEKLDNCLACSNIPQIVNVADADTMLLKDLREYLCEAAQFQMKSPALTTTIDGKSKTLYLPNIKSLEEATRPNLKKTLKELGLRQGQLLVVTDETSPRAVTLQLKFPIKPENNDVEML